MYRARTESWPRWSSRCSSQTRCEKDGAPLKVEQERRGGEDWATERYTFEAVNGGRSRMRCGSFLPSLSPGQPWRPSRSQQSISSSQENERKRKMKGVVKLRTFKRESVTMTVYAVIATRFGNSLYYEFPKRNSVHFAHVHNVILTVINP